MILVAASDGGFEGGVGDVGRSVVSREGKREGELKGRENGDLRGETPMGEGGECAGLAAQQKRGKEDLNREGP